MKVCRGFTYQGGWFLGDFESAALRVKGFEVCLKKHAKDEVWPAHYHKEAIEINYLISGRMTIHNSELIADDVFIFEPGEIADPVFLEDCVLIVVKIPSVPGDKVFVS